MAEPILGKAAKLQALEEISRAAGDHRRPRRWRWAMAPTIWPMLRAAGAGVALHAKPVVAAQCDVRVNHGDLTALLYLQGYSGEEFAG